MVIKKISSDFGIDINLKSDDGVFKIYYGGNLDLYWSFYPKDFELESGKYKITIEKEDILYSIFKELYDDILTCSFSSRASSLQMSDEYKLLCQGETICWHSDEQGYNDANCVSISNFQNQIQIEFDFKNIDMYLENSIRIRNRGSRYHPFNQAFMKHYQTLCNIDEKEIEHPKIKRKEYLQKT